MGLVWYLFSYGAALLGVALVAACLFVTRNFGHWKKKGVKQLTPLPFVGNLKDVVLMRKNIGMVVTEIYEQHKKEPYIGLYAFDEPVLQIHDLDLVKVLLVKDFQYFCDRSVQANVEIDPMAARNLLRMKGDRWRQCRRAISHSFSSGKIKRLYEFVAECGRLLVQTVKREASIGKPISIYELTARYTTDVIASCAFGIQGNNLVDPNAEFRRFLKMSFEFTPLRAVLANASFLAPNLVKVLGVKVMRPEAENFVRKTIHSVIMEREEHHIKRNDLLDNLIQLKNSSSISNENQNKSSLPFAFNEEDICGHSFAFFNAGFETTAHTIHYALYELALNKDVQERLRKEIQQVSMDELSYETLQGMQYLDMVIRETLRKYPPLGFLDRISNRAYTLPGTTLTLKKGTRVIVPVLGLQMDPEFHPNPKLFDPERFSEENKKKFVNYTHMPFGEGPRTCVGMRLAVMKTKSAIAHLITKYSVHPCSGTPREIKFNPKTFLMQSKHAIELVFRQLE